MKPFEDSCEETWRKLMLSDRQNRLFLSSDRTHFVAMDCNKIRVHLKQGAPIQIVTSDDGTDEDTVLSGEIYSLHPHHVTCILWDKGELIFKTLHSLSRTARVIRDTGSAEGVLVARYKKQRATRKVFPSVSGVGGHSIRQD
jgi:hypothetical protein